MFTLYKADVPDAQGRALIDTIVAAESIQDAVSKGCRVINLSFGGPGIPRQLHQAIQDAVAAGVLVVCSAGNERSDNDLVSVFPANEPGVISVGGTDRADALFVNGPEGGSNYGWHSVALAAPGEGILVAPSSSTSLTTATGTSFAAPAVVASLAWLMSNGMTSEQAKRALLNSVDSVVALQGKVSTSGRLDAGRAQRADLNPEPSVTLPAMMTAVKKQTFTLQGELFDPTNELVLLHWDFGDGRNDDTEIPQPWVQHRYKRPGVYTVTCASSTIVGQIGVSSTTVTVQRPQ